jgi:nucleoside-diphosphate-sugar epimerase
MIAKNLFIAGATGHTGRELVRLASEAKLPAIAHVRPDSSKRDEWHDMFASYGATVSDTPWNEEALRDSLRSLAPAIVFALLGTTRARAKRESATHGTIINYEAVDYGLTAMLFRAASTLAKPPRFVYLSSTGTPANEPRPGSYMHARWKVEQMLLAGALPYTIVRPSFIAGPGRDEPRPGERVGALLIDGALSVAAVFGGRKISRRYRSTTNTALATALLRLGRDPAMSGRIVESEDLR